MLNDETRISAMDATLAGDVIVGGVGVRFVAVRAFEGTDVRAGNNRVRALAGDKLTRLDGKSQETSFAFDQPDKGHLLISPQNILTVAAGVVEWLSAAA
jgi:hypothetical protein